MESQMAHVCLWEWECESISWRLGRVTIRGSLVVSVLIGSQVQLRL